MECPLCLWALPPPHCHGALIFDGNAYVCDVRGGACPDIHPLRLRCGLRTSERPAAGGNALH